MKILFVGMEDSYHTYRWISKIETGDSMYLFSSHTRKPKINRFDSKPKKVPVFQNSFGIFDRIWFSFRVVLRTLGSKPGFSGVQSLRKEMRPQRLREAKQLASLLWWIARIKPDVIHSLHTQSAGYLVAKAKAALRGDFPVWVHSVWGSDLYFWGRFPEHAEQISTMLANVDRFWGEGERDCSLAAKLGFKGLFLPCVPAGGGIDFGKVPPQSSIPASRRTVIMVKGYQYLLGRFFVALRALERARDVVAGYQIMVFAADNDAKRLCELYQYDHGIKIKIIENVSDEEMLGLLSMARVYIGLSISDGLPSSLLEAMATGVFPIQSNTAINDGLIEDGVNGFLVEPNDPDAVEKALRRSLADDALVDAAWSENRIRIQNRFDRTRIADTVRNSYQSIQSVEIARKARRV